MRKSQVYQSKFLKKSWAGRKPHRIKRKKSIFKNRFFRLGILFLILGISVFHLLIFSSVFQVKKVVITGEKRASTGALKQVIWQEIGEQFLFFTTKSIFLVSPPKIRQSILNNFPVIANVEIHRGFPDALDVVAIERLAAANWCGGNQCFLLDTEGVIFEEITATGTNLLSIETPDFNVASKPGDSVIEKERFSRILKIVSGLKENLKISTELAEFIPKEERLNIKTSEGWKVYFNLGGDIDWQITELALLLENKVSLEEREKLEYIDLRFNRVFINTVNFGQ